VVSIVAVSAMAWTTAANADPDEGLATDLYNGTMSMMNDYCNNYFPQNYWSCRSDYLTNASNLLSETAQGLYAQNQEDAGDTFALASDWVWNSIYS
jgi:hypothetical protein